MKRAFMILATAAITACACNKDIITTTDDTVENPSSANDSNDATEAEGRYDDISITTFDREISISWNGSSVTVEGDANGTVSSSGGIVTIDSRSAGETVRYTLGGTCSDGCLKIYSNKPQALVLNSLSLGNSDGAAINNQGHFRTFVVLQGSSSLSDGSSYKGTSGEDEKAAFFSEGQLVFSGSGSLSVSARGKGGIVSDDYLRFMGSQSVSASSSAGNAMKGKDGVTIDDGLISATSTAAGKKGISSDGTVTINGGSVTVSVSGGTATETVNGSTEYSGACGIKSDGTFTMAGGFLDVSSSGQGGKGISGDGEGIFKGGVVSVKVTGSNLSGGSSGGWGGGRPGMGGGMGGSNNLKAAKGIKFDGNITISGGTISVSASSHEGIESKGTLNMSGGVVYAYSAADDAINSAGDMTLSGGYVCGWSAGNDGLDSNGNLYIKGACAYAVCTAGSPELGVDANTEQNKKLYLQSGTLVAIGGIESGSSITGTAYSGSGWTKNAWHALYDKSGKVIFAFKTPSSSGNSTMVVYGDGAEVSLKSGVSTSGGSSIWDALGLIPGNVSGGNPVTLSSYSSSGGNGGWGGRF